MGRGSEAPVERAFKRWLVEAGWRIVDDTGSWGDVIAERGEERLVGEVKGYTGPSTGLDVDTMYGQLLRRMVPGAATTWAVVVPTRSAKAALRFRSSPSGAGRGVCVTPQGAGTEVATGVIRDA